MCNRNCTGSNGTRNGELYVLAWHLIKSDCHWRTVQRWRRRPNAAGVHKVPSATCIGMMHKMCINWNGMCLCLCVRFIAAAVALLPLTCIWIHYSHCGLPSIDEKEIIENILLCCQIINTNNANKNKRLLEAAIESIRFDSIRVEKNCFFNRRIQCVPWRTWKMAYFSGCRKCL